MRTTYTPFAVLALLGTLTVGAAVAKDDALEFIHVLQREGYSDVAIDYLEELKADPASAPKDVMELWDLEMSRSKKDAAKDAYSPTQAKQWADDSKALLEKFIKENPQRPEAIQEAARWSVEQATQAQYDLVRATYASDKAEKAAILAKARKIFEQIRPRFVEAAKASDQLFRSLPPGRRTTTAKREEVRLMAGENRLLVAMVDFYMAQTLEAGAERSATLTKLIKEFDAIFQDYREAFVGWKAHFFHARILQELGQFQDAKDVYEEVAACDPANIEDVGTRQTGSARVFRPTGLEGFFADVEQYYLQTLHLMSQKDYKEYLEEAKSWRAAHKLSSEKTYGYQALTLDLVKNYLEIGEKTNKKEAAKGIGLKLLAEMVKIESPYQQDAIKLRRQLNPNATAEQGFEDAVIDGDAAIGKKQWAEAAELYEKALGAATTKTDKNRLAEVRNTLVGCYHNLAVQLYQKSKIEDAVTTAKKALKPEFLQTKTAPGVAVFLLNVLEYQYRSAPEGADAEKKAKADLLTKVSNTAKAILKHWAGREEGDAARIVLMRLAQDQGNVAEADRILSEINPSSREYPTALTAMGYAHWAKYRTASKQIEAAQAKNAGKKNKNEGIDKDLLAKCEEDHRLALEYVQKAVNSMGGDASHSAGAGAPATVRDAQLFLADMYREGNDYKQAAAIYKSLLDAMLKDPSKPFDDAALRIFDGAGQSFLQLGDVESFSLVGAKLIELGPDQERVDRAIVNFAVRLEKERKNAVAEGDSAAAKLKSLADLEEKIMINLAGRDKVAPASMIWIVKTTSELGTDDAIKAAAKLIENIFDKANNDQDFQREIGKAEASLHSLGAGLLAKLGEYQKAQDQIDALIQKYPRALEPRVSEAKILTEWAAKDASKYAEAIDKWDTLRKKLERIKTSDPKGGAAKKIDPRYEVIYNEAECFFKMAQKTKDKDDGKKGLDLLLPYLNLDPNIRTPGDQYKELGAKYFHLGAKLADFVGVPPPLRPKAKPADK